MKNGDLFEVGRQNLFLQSVTSVSSRKIFFDFVQHKLNGNMWSTSYTNLVKRQILNFSVGLSKKWRKSYRNTTKFKKNYSEWLNATFKMPKNEVIINSASTVGRRSKQFDKCTERTKRRKINVLLNSNIELTSPEIISAAKHKINKSGQRSVVQIFNTTTTTPKRAKKIKKILKNSETLKPIPYNPDEALAFFIENNLTKQQYVNIRLSAKKRNADIFPPYNSIINAKKQCYPKNCIMSETYCEIKLQDLLDHTSTRIFLIPDIKINELFLKSFEILYKWGCDGSNGQSQYKQKYSDNNNSSSDKDLFLFSIVPLQLNSFDEQNNKHIIWTNNRTSSTRFCRPIKFKFEKETVETTLKEVNSVEDQIKQLTPTEILFNGNRILVKHTLMFTMVDGKVK